MPYYPEQSLVMGVTTIRRERTLPPGAIGEVLVKVGDFVEGPDVVLRGAISGQYVIINALEGLGVRSVDKLTPEMFLVQTGEAVNTGQVIAQNRRRKILAPQTAVVSRLDGDQIILQLNPTPIEVRALCPGSVASVRGTSGVLITAIGALIQCVWGNGKQVFSAYRAEPPEGIESLPSDGLLPQYRGIAMIINKPILTTRIFDIVNGQEMTALIAPSMNSNLRGLALMQKFPVILTEGFGEQKMSEMVYNLLSGNVGRQTTIDAIEPTKWSAARPELIIPLQTGGVTPPAAEINQPLQPGTLVRVTRAPHLGASGRVKRILDTPREVESGLRLPGAEIQTVGGRVIFVPLANLETLGQPAETQDSAT